MRIPKRAAFSSGALLLTAVLLAGCSGPKHHADPTPTRSSSPVPTPIFTSDADALAAATDVYRHYLAVADAVSHDGGEAVSRFDLVATGQARQRAGEAAAQLATRKWHTKGVTGLDAAQFRTWDADVASVTIGFYVCEDIANVDLLDANGASQVKRGRVNLVPYQVDVAGPDTWHLKVEQRMPWDHPGVCA